jgi:hypothetical protein
MGIGRGKWLLVWGWVGALAAVLVAAGPAPGQELEPRSYVNTPVGLNFLLAGYGYTHGDVVFSASAPIQDAEVDTHAGVVAYLRSVDVFGSSGKVGLIVPFADASGSALLAGQRRDREVFGLADPTRSSSTARPGCTAAPAPILTPWESPGRSDGEVVYERRRVVVCGARPIARARDLAHTDLGGPRR